MLVISTDLIKALVGCLEVLVLGKLDQHISHLDFDLFWRAKRSVDRQILADIICFFWIISLKLKYRIL